VTAHCLDIGQGRPLILLHGWAAHAGFFAAQAALAWSGFRVLAPDLPGHGSNRAEKAATLADLADSVHRLIEDRGLSDVVLVGWSLGAAVAFDYIGRHGCGRLGRLVVLDMAPRILNDAGWSLGIAGAFDARINAAALTAMAADWPAYATRFLPRLFARGGDPDPALAAWARAQLADNDAGVMTALWRSLSAADHRPVLGRISVPTLVVNGRQSRIYQPATSDWLAARIPAAQRLTIDNAGHSPQLEQPFAVNQALAAFAGA
jgi:pimeloyl-ACP methyl ester carboxylesterase